MGRSRRGNDDSRAAYHPGPMRSRSDTLVIVNPASAGGRTGRRWPLMRAALDVAGVDHDVHLTAAPGEATTRTRQALRQGYRRIVVAGGDGTLNEAVNGFFDAAGTPLNQDASLGLLPSGTGGDFRRAIGLSTDPATAAAVVAAGHTRRIDAGLIVFDDASTPPQHFINIADCGVGGEIVARVNRSQRKAGGLRGTAVFLGISLRTLASFAGRRVHLELDGDPLELDVGNVVVANGRCFGGGMRIAPDAELDDGLFDVVVIRAMGRWRTLSAMPSVYRGAHLRQPGVVHRRAAQVRVVPGDDVPLLFDVEGEQIGQAPATITIVPAALRVCIPPLGS